MDSTLESKGYLIQESSILKSDANELLHKLITSYRGEWDEIWAPRNRIHIPLEIEGIFKLLLKEIISNTTSLIPELTTSNDLNNLAEFASITSFPSSEAQAWHRDSRDPTGLLFSAFVNLLEITDEVGPLQVVRGSHKDIQPDATVKKKDIITLTLPAMSLVIMDSRIIHRGGTNSSKNKIRPVIYASFGRIDLADPGYHIKEKYRHYGFPKLSEIYESL